MSNIKTKVSDASVRDYIEDKVNNAQKREDSYEIIRLMEEVTGEPAKMWGTSMIGCGVYHYKSDRSKQEGDWPLVAFSPRKSAISLYIYTGLESHLQVLDGLGKYTMGKACIYIKKLADIDTTIMKQIMQHTIEYLKDKYPN